MDLGRMLKGRRVLLTGHTGFKGGWMALWLRKLGADVTGIALPALPGPNFHDAVRLGDAIDDRIGDITLPADFAAKVADVDADLVIHMAAQALVRPSYESPAETYLTNVVGTCVVLDAARRMPSLKAAIVVTSDKCYENNEWDWAYREDDRLGGADPYSNSKACTELVTASYRRSFFSDPNGPRLASVRAGNVFGGGDWAVDRLLPDFFRAIAAGEPIHIRNPASVRPWQHVLEPLSGYLTLAAHMLAGEDDYAEGWNFGPAPEPVIEVGALARIVHENWGPGAPELILADRPAGPHEAGMLRLDSSKARNRLGWRPVLDVEEAVRWTVDWHRAHFDGATDMRAFTESQIDRYEALRRPDADQDNRLGKLQGAQCA